MSQADGFNVVKKQVEIKLDTITALYVKWKKMNSIGNYLEASNLESNLLSDISDVEWEVDQLGQTVVSVEKDFKSFNLTKSEVSARKEFVVNSRNKLQTIQRELQDKPQAPHKGFSASAPASSQAGSEGGYGDQLLQKKIYQEQDVILDRFHDQAQEIGRITEVISTTLEEQNEFLKDFERDVEDTHERVVDSNRYIDKLLEQTKNNKAWIAIVLLTICLIIVAGTSLSKG